MRKFFKPVKKVPRKKVAEVSVLDYFKSTKVVKAGEDTPRRSKYFAKKKSSSVQKGKAVEASVVKNGEESVGSKRKRPSSELSNDSPFQPVKKKRVAPSNLFGAPKKTSSIADDSSVHSKREKKIAHCKDTDGSVNLTAKVPSKYPICEPWCLSLKNVVFTGNFSDWNEKELKTLVIRNGGRLRTEVTMLTSYVVTGENPDRSIVNKAKCPTHTMSEFLKLLPKLPQRAPPKIRTKQQKTETLWVDKYKPKRIQELVGHKSLVKRLQTYLRSWPRLKSAKPGTVKRACLLSGPPGLGKSTAATVVAAEMGFRVLEFNASDARGRKVLQNNVQAATDHHALSEFAQVGEKRHVKKPVVLIMDEVDGMSSGDRGGVTQLIQFIKTSKVPILCICNDRAKDSIRSLANHCEDLRFRKPTPEMIASRMLQICKIEGVKVSREFLERMVSGLNGDLRQVINLLQLWSNTPEKLLDIGTVEKGLASAQKDITVGPWDVVPQFFTMHNKVSPKDRIYKGTEWYFVDQMIIPLFIFENYLHGVWNDNVSVISDFADAAESMADGDIIDSIIRQRQDYSFMPMFATLFCIRPCLLTGRARGIREFSQRVNFPMWLGKNSARNKNLRLLSEICQHISGEVTGNNVSFLKEYLPALRRKLSEPLLRNGIAGIAEVVSTLKTYNLSREDWDIIIGDLDLDLSKVLPDFFDAINIPGKVKTKLTRTCKDENVMMYTESKNKSVTTVRALMNEEKDEDEEVGVKKKKKKKDNKFFKKKKAPRKKTTKKKATKRTRKT